MVSVAQKAEFIILVLLTLLFCFFTILLFIKNIKQKRIYEKKIAELENRLRYDFMTGTLSRPAFIKDMESMLNAEPRGTLLIFDVNGFKTVNDTFGHIEGDALIKRYAQRLTKAFGKNLVGRLGGDEFLVYISGSCNKSEINSQLKKYGITEFPDKPTKMILTSCCGAAIAPSNGTNFDDLYRKADKALYHSKKTGHEIVYCK